MRIVIDMKFVICGVPLNYSCKPFSIKTAQLNCALQAGHTGLRQKKLAR
jgi:hypothetical protein